MPRDLPSNVSLPVSYLLGRTRLALAELRLTQAKARDDHAAADRQKARPDFPRIGVEEGGISGGRHSGKGPTAGGLDSSASAHPPRVDETVIIDFIDEMDEAQPAFVPSLLPEDMGLTLAESAAGECVRAMKYFFTFVLFMILSGYFYFLLSISVFYCCCSDSVITQFLQV